MTTPGDSAGVPWEGRNLAPNPFAGDDGRADAHLRAVLDSLAEAPLDPRRHVAVVRALSGARVYAPILPTAVEHSTDSRGFVHDNRSDMAMVRLASEDGRQATPLFTDIPTLTAWGTSARPVPIESERLCVAAIEEGAELVVVDAGSSHTFLLRRPALWAFVQGQAWTPPWADSDVAAALAGLAGEFSWIAGIDVAPGSARVAEAGPEVALVITAARQPGDADLASFQEALAATPVIVDRVDSMTLSLRG